MFFIKVCGMRDAENIRAIDEIGVDMMGFSFWPESKRYVAERPAYMPQHALKAGVFVDMSIDDILTKVKEFDLDIVQLHGDENLAFVSELRKVLEADGHQEMKIVKAISVASRSSVLKAMMWDGYVDGILFQTPTDGFDGNGLSFDWSLLSSYRARTPFFLTGGIGPESLDALKEFSHPQWVGVDLNSRFETAPGIKDVEAVRHFVEELRKCRTQE